MLSRKAASMPSKSQSWSDHESADHETEDRFGKQDASSCSSKKSGDGRTSIHLVERQPELLVLELKTDGSSRYLDLRRDDLLHLARASAKGLTRTLSEEVDFDSREPVPERKVNDWKSRIARVPGGLQARDLRRLDTSFSSSQDPDIIVRRSACIVNLGELKALVLHDRCFVVVPEGADSVLQVLISDLKSVSRSAPAASTSCNSSGASTALVPPSPLDTVPMDTPFEFRALEAILKTAARRISSDAKSLEPEVRETVSNILDHTGGGSFEELRNVTLHVRRLLDRVLGVRGAIAELLEHDRDMALLSLTRVRDHPEWYLESNAREWENDHEDAELLFEHYLADFDGSLGTLRRFELELESVSSVLRIRLDTARNNLLRVELMVSSVTSMAAVGALIVGAFGMNLNVEQALHIDTDSGDDPRPGLFWGVFAAVVGGCFGGVAIMFFVVWRKGMLITTVSGVGEAAGTPPQRMMNARGARMSQV